MAKKTKKIVLIVDDERALLKALKARFEKEGVDVMCAKDGLEALDILRDKGREIAVVVTDINMPYFDGLALIDVMGPRIPVIMMTNLEDEKLKSKALDYPHVYAWASKANTTLKDFYALVKKYGGL